MLISFMLTLEQHERHANEVRLMHDYDYLISPQQYHKTHQSSTPLSVTYPSNDFQSLIHHNVYSPSSSIPQLEYPLQINQQSEFSQQDSGLIILVFQKDDDPIDAINHMMLFFTVVVTSRYPTTNNQLRNSSNPRTYTPGACGSNSGKQRMVICYNCKGEGHMSRQCTKPKRKRDDSWFKEKCCGTKLQAHGQILNEEELVFLADPDIPEVALMENLSHYGSDALAEVHNHDNMNNNMAHQVVQVMSSSQQSNVVNHSETKITSDSNIIPYSQYVIESQQVFKNPSIAETPAVQNQSYMFGDIIVQTNPIVIPDSEETLALAEESRSKKLLKHKDNMMLEKKKQVDTTPIDYAALNQLYKDFPTRFVPQTELSAEQAFWSQNSMNSSELILSIRPTNVEVPKELLKVSMVNTSLRKLKHHLANFDVVVKERTTPTAIIEGSWGFEHTKACFRDEIIPFVKALKDLFSTFNQHLVDELSEVQNVFYQMEQAVEQHRIESKTFEVKMNQVLNENERLLEQVMSKDIVNLLVNPSVNIASVNVHEMEQAMEQHRLESKTFEVKMNQVLNENERLLEQVLGKDIVNIIVNSFVNIASVNVHDCEKCLKLETELLNKKDFVEKEIYDKLFKSFTTLEKHCISLEVDIQHNQEIFQRDNSVSNQSELDLEAKGSYVTRRGHVGGLEGDD
ncbi:retrovirus-related pol polyprotein from transposon TNT 1-94 [Tanacetum coccineum]